MRKIFGSLFLVSLFLNYSQAEAARISFVGAANSSEAKESGTDYSGVTGYGGGVLIETRLLPMLGFEFGALYLPRKFKTDTTSPLDATVTSEGKMYEFPVLLRAHLGRILSFGLGGYYASATGQITTQTKTGNVTATNHYSFAEANQTTSDFGIDEM